MARRNRQGGRNNGNNPNSSNTNRPPQNIGSSSSTVCVITEADLDIRFRNKTTPEERVQVRVDRFLSLHPTGKNVREQRDAIKKFAHYIRSGDYTDNDFYHFTSMRSLHVRAWLGTVRQSIQLRQWVVSAEIADEVIRRVYSHYLAWNPRVVGEFPILVEHNKLDLIQAPDQETLLNTIRSLPTPRNRVGAERQDGEAVGDDPWKEFLSRFEEGARNGCVSNRTS
ncbi:hypothetical protein DM02DRAFT_657572 [Periconia macrospinosa]|uniref:Uncharacterized protein n=1 Tax=Periconia macrospinosa TaxID=97972 RepID=A0A2V1DJ70_9PLEO|nr:hypothetical protein DM02DRAFT_657572 [Periconia macrospinosa]